MIFSVIPKLKLSMSLCFPIFSFSSGAWKDHVKEEKDDESSQKEIYFALALQR